MKVSARKRRNSCGGRSPCSHVCRLNEGPYGKVGKYTGHHFYAVAACASMKVPPKRKGNSTFLSVIINQSVRLNESPSEKEGKCLHLVLMKPHSEGASMKVPPKRKGNGVTSHLDAAVRAASMKVPPKRKGNSTTTRATAPTHKEPQ